MPRFLSFALLGVALLNNLASGFSHSNIMPLPTSSSLRLPLQHKPRPSMQTNSDAIGTYAKITSPLLVRGGARAMANENVNEAAAYDLNLSTGKVIASLWGTCGVAYILIKAIKRVVPIALEPFMTGEGVVPLTNVQLAAYILTCLWFAYVEGYKGFQRKFSPLVVSRSFTLQPSLSTIHHVILAPFYSMGLFHATRKRMIVSWSVSVGVTAIVAAVKRFPYPWRNIVDAGVVVGLTWGTVSILGGYIISLVTGIAPIGVDPSLPEKN
eukprot:CAMPEP_0171328722 /NCGR_PEP_ID=MMETSP0878-20121228/815_1 /TAXON_ID=67004 /ORGANISM="Thalassiosira weissflogii, Strain CCMP1336" /LENGTH=267 /DNA_ID=CAMNT_0011828591 /DNA_START=246 /DNA_END=1049 /DNA_ORIENTATION=+